MSNYGLFGIIVEAIGLVLLAFAIVGAFMLITENLGKALVNSKITKKDTSLK